MSDPKDKDRPDDDPAAEIRRGRPFDLAEAVGREAGGALKGASPVPPSRQLLLEMGELLDAWLPDAEGSLRRTALVRLEGNPPLLARHHGDPRGALRAWVDSVLASRLALADFVRHVDAHWGRDYGEKPRFDPDRGEPAPDDPYTLAGVEAALRELRAALDDAEA